MCCKRGFILCFYLFALYILPQQGIYGASDVAAIKSGILDLRSMARNSSFSVTMNGEWEFYPDTFIVPGSPYLNKEKPSFIKVPSVWSSGKGTSGSMSGTGYASYRCRILLPPGYRENIGFDMPAFETSYQMYVNGVMMSSGGKTGRNESESAPGYNPRLIKYAPTADTLEIVIKVSNFEVSRGGFWLPMKTGSFNKIQKAYSDTWIVLIVNSSMLFTVFLLSLIIFLADRKNKRFLIFSMLILPLALRPWFSTPYIITMLDDVNWTLIYKLKYINLMVLLTGGVLFVSTRFPSKVSAIAKQILATALLALIILAIFVSPYLLSYSDPLINGIATLLIVYAIIVNLVKIRSWKIPDIIYFLSIATIATGAFFDIRLSTGKEGCCRVFLSSFTFLAYALVQSVLLIREWIKDSAEREKFYLRSEELMKNLEKRVDERTAELSQKNTEIEDQNRLITEQNKKLSDTISVKNRIFSVISHDLRSPVVNILYGLNLIKDAGTEEEKEFLINSCIRNSKQAITLLENMLIWGRDQNDQIRYSPDIYDLADIILTNMSIFKENADKKNIRLNFTQIGSSKGWFDKDLIDAVVRNLLSNAVKFTGNCGRVNIILKEDSKAGSLILKVADNGVGIAGDRIGNLFSSENMQSTSGTANEKGSGIGLKLVYEFTRICKGEISVESTAGEGTCFTVVLPRPNSEVQYSQLADRASIN